MKARLTKLRSSHNNLRTSMIEGETIAQPTLGESFMLFAEPLETSVGVRVVSTMLVTSIDRLDESSVKFQTKNSCYLFEIL